MSATLTERDDWAGLADPYADLVYGSDVCPVEPEPDDWEQDSDPWPTGAADSGTGDPWPFGDAPSALLAPRVPVGAGRRQTRSQRLAVEYRAYLDARYRAAEEWCRGHMVTAGGLRRGVTAGRAWFGGRHSTLRFASDELAEWFEENGPCLSATEWRRQQTEHVETTETESPAVVVEHQEETPSCRPVNDRSTGLVLPGAGTRTWGRLPARRYVYAVRNVPLTSRNWTYRAGRWSLRPGGRLGSMLRLSGWSLRWQPGGRGRMPSRAWSGAGCAPSWASQSISGTTHRTVGIGVPVESRCTWMRAQPRRWTSSRLRRCGCRFRARGLSRSARCWPLGLPHVVRGDRTRTQRDIGWPPAGHGAGTGHCGARRDDRAGRGQKWSDRTGPGGSVILRSGGQPRPTGRVRFDHRWDLHPYNRKSGFS